MAIVVGKTADGGTKMSDGTIVYANKKNNTPVAPSSSVNPTTGFDYLKSSFDVSQAPKTTGAITGQGTTSQQTAQLPIIQGVIPPAPAQSQTATSSMAGRKNNTQSDKSLMQSSLRNLVQNGTITNPEPITTQPETSTSSMTGRINIPKNTVNTIQETSLPIQGTATTSIPKKSNGILDQTPEDIYNQKKTALSKIKESDVLMKQAELQKGTDVLNTNNKLLMRLYGIDDKGNVDTTNPNGLASKIEQAKIEYKDTKNKLLSEYSGARLRNVQSQIRRMLTQRGIDISKIPQEQLIQLSGEIGSQAFNDIYSAKEKTVNDILDNGQKAEDKINGLREKGLLSQNDLRIATETLRSKVINDINNINRQFANDIFGLQDKTRSDIDQKKSAAINAISQFGAQLGLSGTKLGAITSYINNFTNATDALTAMVQDLANPNSAIAKTVGSIETANLLARQAQAALEERKVAATETKARASLLSAAKSSGSNFKLPSAIVPVISGVLGKNIQDVTVDDYNGLLNEDTPRGRNFRSLISKDITTLSE